MELADVEAVMDRFVAATTSRLRPVAIWAHGSLAGGDFQPARSDLDLIVVVPERLTPRQLAELATYHRQLRRAEPAAAKLHCSYMPMSQAADVSVSHFTWAGGRTLSRPVSPVTRCELLGFGRVLMGAAPAAVLPPVTDEDLAAYVRYSLRKHVLDVVAWPQNCLRDSYVDLCTLIVARAAITLRDGRLVTKAQALDELARRGAPVRLVADIRRRRYGAIKETSAARVTRDPGKRLLWRVQRALIFRRYVRAEVRELLKSEPAATR